MNKRNLVLAAGVATVLLGSLFFIGKGKKAVAQYRPVSPVLGAIESSVSATGTVQPQNRLEIKPPISGRIEKILVQEGEAVKAGKILALMSSTDRAALMDAARLQGEDTMKSWEDVYKPTPLIAPIDADVIVKGVEPGQTVSASDAVIVLSDRLIVEAQVDETDIGKVKTGQEAVITLDAYPNIEVRARVDHVSYESTTVSNVTIYTVDIVPEHIPEVFRSGMSANVKIVQERRDNLLLVPEQAVKKKDGRSYVLLGQGRGKAPLERDVEAGLSDGDNVEIVRGLTLEDKVLLAATAYSSSPSAAQTGKNPFMPTPPGGRRSSR